MKQEKFNSLMVAIVAIAAVFGFTSIVWASFSQTLKIENSSATINASKWDIHFGEISALDTTGTASGTRPSADAKSTTLSGFNAVLKTPGDSVSFTVKVENHGSYNAAISSYVLPQIGTMTSAAEDATVGAADINKIKDYVSVSFTYDDGTLLAAGDALNAASSSVPGTRTVRMTVKLDEGTPSTALPTAAITVPITPTSIVYGQVA